MVLHFLCEYSCCVAVFVVFRNLPGLNGYNVGSCATCCAADQCLLIVVPR